jgi:hypothetical protein
MAAAHDHLRRVLQGGTMPEDAADHHWHAIRRSLQEVAEDDSPDSVALLRDILVYEGDIALTDDSPAPHAMSPSDMLRAHAAHVLARRDLAAHSDVLDHVARTARSDVLRGIARQHLGRPPAGR